MREHLQSRERLIEYLAAADFNDDIQEILSAYDNQSLFHYDNITSLQVCYEKAWLKGERLLADDFANITIDRMLLLKILAALLVPLIRQRHLELGLPAAVTVETCRAPGNAFRAMAEYPDALIKTLHWIGKYYRDIMFKTGIFNYRLARLSPNLPVYALRELATGKAMALAADGLEIDAGGLIAGDDVKPDFTTRLRITPTEITGNQVSPAGRILSQTLTLRRDEWEAVVEPGGITAEIHIPPGRPMLPGDCRASMLAAADVIRQCLPQHGVKCFTCLSWILNPDWLELLPESNMAQFMRELYLFPIKTGPAAGVNFVFRKPPAELDLKTAPRKSRLQRIMLEHLEQGKPLHAGGMFILFDDLEHFGAQYYQNK